jgi:hypothetical protein
MRPSRVLLVANRTATDAPLLEAVRRRAARGPVTFHLVVPATPQGLHRVVDPEVAGLEAAERRLRSALVALSEAAGQVVSGHVATPTRSPQWRTPSIFAASTRSCSRLSPRGCPGGCGSICPARSARLGYRYSTCLRTSQPAPRWDWRRWLSRGAG